MEFTENLCLNFVKFFTYKSFAQKLVTSVFQLYNWANLINATSEPEVCRLQTNRFASVGVYGWKKRAEDYIK